MLVGIDRSAESKRALRWAADYAQMSRARLHALIAWDIPASYGMPAICDDIDLEAQARTRLAEAVADVLGDSVTGTLRAERATPPSSSSPPLRTRGCLSSARMATAASPPH